MSNDPVDRTLYLVRSGRAHVAALDGLTETHNLPGTAGYILRTLGQGEKDPDLVKLLQALAAHRDTDPASDTYGCLKWYAEDEAINDTNASFFICLPLTLVHLLHHDRLTPEELEALRGVFVAVEPWFSHMAASPSMFYPNKCLGDVAMLRATGHVLQDEAIIARARDFCRRWLDYVDNRGMGWGEDHSPVYLTVIVEMSLLLMWLEGAGELTDRLRRLVDKLLEWVDFHDGWDAVPSIRGYNFDCDPKPRYGVRDLFAGAQPADAGAQLLLLARAVGYAYTPQPQSAPRERRWRTFDSHWSVSHVGPRARLGTLSHYPLMPNTYMHDAWGLGWQTKPASFIVEEQEYGVLEWISEDDEGVIRQHQIATGFHEWASRHLFKRLAFHPEVTFTAHQAGGAAIIFREVQKLHSLTVRLEDRWRLSRGAGRLLVGGAEWDGQPGAVPADWLVVDYDGVAVALRPLQCRVLDAPDDDPNPQRRTTGQIRTVNPRLERTETGLYVSLPLIAGHSGTVTQPLLFSGWCVVLLERPEDVVSLAVTESFAEDGEVPRTYGELIRTVELTSPYGKLSLVRDMLTGTETRYTEGTLVLPPV